MMKWDIEKKDNKLFVTLTVEHVNFQKSFENKSFDTEFVVQHLKENNISFDGILKQTEVYNYQRQSNLTGTWIFSLPKSKKTKKTTQTLENKENVLKVSNKKTTKK